jgi:hypothetical protein
MQLGHFRPSSTRPGFDESLNGVHVTGQSTDSTGIPEVFYHGSPDGGNTWNADVVISNLDAYGSQWPALAADYLGHVYITWFDYTYSGGGLGDIFIRKSDNDGLAWGDIHILSFSHLAKASTVAANSNGVFVVWEDSRDHIPTDADLYFRFSSDFGETWHDEQRITFNRSNPHNPFLIVDEITLHLFWSDNYTDLAVGNQIHYMKGRLIQTGIEESYNSDFDEILEVYPNPFNSMINIMDCTPNLGHLGLECSGGYRFFH